MICEQHFRLKKNGEPTSKCFCRNPELIENYDLVISDTTQTWVCHHRFETHNSDGERRLVSLSMDELKALGMYYDRPPEEFIFMAQFEHRPLHTSFRNHENPIKHSEETKRKIGEASKGRKKSEGAGKQPKKVLCIETGKIFESTKDAERKTQVNNSNISQVCNGKYGYKTAGGFHWKYI